jgi:hypothetical protein
MTTTKDIHVTALIKGRETYVWLWRDGEVSRLANAVGTAASKYDLSLTWYDAAVILQKARQAADERCIGR